LARTITALDNTALRPSHWVGKPLSDLSIQSSAVFSMEMLLRNLNSMPAEAILQAISNFRAIESRIQPLFDILDIGSQDFFKRHISDFSKALAIFDSIVFIPAGTGAKDIDGQTCTVRSGYLVVLGKIEKEKATFSIPFDDGEIPFCVEGTTPREGLTTEASILKKLTAN
jgi:hypothetical protein